MPECPWAEAQHSARRVELFSTGGAAVGEYHCAECGYGISVQRLLPLCPMCGGNAWRRVPSAAHRPLGPLPAL